MQALWGERRRIGLWRRLWLALMEAQQELGLDIPDRALAELRAHLDDADPERAAEHEKRLRHDVMAHIHHLGEQAPAARAYLHLGATSAYVTDNTDLVLMREGLELLLGRLAAVLVALAKLARRDRAVPCLAYTHFQPAQLTTVGKGVTLWMQDFALDADELLHRHETLQFRGVKGTTGTQASFLELFDGEDEKVRELDARVARKMGFARVFAVTGQTYTRKLDAQVLAALSGVAASAAKFATDLRLLQHEGEMREPVIARHVAGQLPFLATEPLLLRGVKAGGDRQRLHEVIRTHSLAVAQAVAERGAPNDLLERLARDPAFRALKVAARPAELDPATYVGRAPRQVDEFLEHVLPATLRRIEAVAPAAAAAEVTV